MFNVARACIILFLVSSVTFFMLRLLPGGPFDQDTVQRGYLHQQLSQRYGLDRSLTQQYVHYMGALLRGDLGESLVHRDQTVADILTRGLKASMVLGGWALFLVTLGGSLLGGFAGLRPDGAVERWIYRLSTLMICIPSFVSAPLLMAVFSFSWPMSVWWPDTFAGSGLLPAGLWLTPRHMILPVVALALRPMAFFVRLVRASVLEVRRRPFVRTAKAKGSLPWRVFIFHVLRSALTPALSYAGPLAAGLLTGSFVVEVAFAIPGVAHVFVQSVFERDYTVVLGATLLFSTFLLTAHLFVDFLLNLLRPFSEEA